MFQLSCIVTLGGLCGRFDQTLGCIQTLFLARKRFNLNNNCPFYLVHNENLVALLPQVEPKMIFLQFFTGKSIIFLNIGSQHIAHWPKSGDRQVRSGSVWLHGQKCDHSRVAVEPEFGFSSKNYEWRRHFPDFCVENDECVFGGLVSTSNMILNEMVEVSSDQPLLWTMELDLKRLARSSLWNFLL